MRTAILLAITLALSETATASSTLRCGTGLVSTGDLASELRSKCGEPVSQSFLGYREVSDYYGTITEVAIEEWVYGPRNGMYYFLRLEGNRLIKIESKRKN
ncbi:DUF2845 domain-containing protein [Pseudomonas sp. BMS12]|uniref:DUF2845 domain-containing protein n=1 Tax=Pseudomonas sp. BMS12 TaxID=1796033 RepID=UPI00083A7A4C|nr:DUF2845 domain-containing protein [Pseudomonas sp. BMS12]